MRPLLTALAVPVFVLGIGLGTSQMVGRPTMPPSKQPTSIVWADRVYLSKEELAKWLHARGGTYEEWAARHDEMAAVLEGRPPASAEHPTASADQPAAQVAAHELSAAEHAGESKRLGPAIGLIAASLLGFFALTVMLRRRLPPLAFARVRRAFSQRGPPRPSPRIQVRGTFDALIRSASALGETLAELEERLRSPARVRRDQGPGEAYARAGLRESLHQHAPDIAFCVVSVLGAVVVALSLALYLS